MSLECQKRKLCFVMRKKSLHQAQHEFFLQIYRTYFLELQTHLKGQLCEIYKDKKDYESNNSTIAHAFTRRTREKRANA